MNRNTGEIVEISPLMKKFLEGKPKKKVEKIMREKMNCFPLVKLPEKKCLKCKGIGWVGRNKSNFVVPCECTQ